MQLTRIAHPCTVVQTMQKAGVTRDVLATSKRPKLIYFGHVIRILTSHGRIRGRRTARAPYTRQYTGGVCLKHPNKWHSVTFGQYRWVFWPLVHLSTLGRARKKGHQNTKENSHPSSWNAEYATDILTAFTHYIVLLCYGMSRYSVSSQCCTVL